MDLVVRFVLFILVAITDLRLIETSNRDPILKHDNGICWLHNGSIGVNYKITADCETLHLSYINFTENSQELFDRLAEGVKTMEIVRCNIDNVYLPHNLIEFQLIGNDGAVTQVVVDKNATYRLQSVTLHNVVQLPTDIGKLNLLKSINCIKVYGANVNLTTFSSMEQLEEITINDIGSVIVPDSLILPSLKKLTIMNSILEFFNETSCPTPKLEVLLLESNNLVVIPIFCTTCTNLKVLSIRRNMLRSFTLNFLTNLNQLNFLALIDNRISNITTQTTLKLPHLKQLYLSDNDLADLDVTLWNFPALHFLSLGNNKLKRVAGLVELFTGRKCTLAAANNPWNCEWVNETIQQLPGVHLYGSENDSCVVLKEHAFVFSKRIDIQRQNEN